MHNKELTRISRGMAAILRHGIGGAEIDENGWAKLNELSQTLTKILRTKVTEEDILNVVKNDIIGRYELDVDKMKIRALYGHSIPVAIEYKIIKPYEVKDLYHGTVMEKIDSIMCEGLKPLNRLWVHLYSSYKLAVERSLRRKGRPAILTIDAKQLAASKYMLFKAGKYVYVTKHVPSKFIKRITKLESYHENLKA